MKGLIFDYGGTIDTAGDHWSYIIQQGWEIAGIHANIEEFRESYVFAERALAKNPLILPHHTFLDMLKIKMRIELQHFSEKHPLSEDEINSKSNEIASYCYQQARCSVNRAIPIIKMLKELYPIVLVSNFYGNIKEVLSDFKADNLFDDIIESAVVGVRKPDPEIFRLGCKALHLPPQELTVIGDSYKKDILPALSIGCQAIWIKGRCWSSEEQQQDYQPTISSLNQLPGVLARNN